MASEEADTADVLRLRLALATLIAIILVCGAVFVGVGFLAAVKPATFDWSTASVAATAFGTLALAVTTAGLAYASATDVRATRALADQARKDADERREPIVAIQAIEFGPTLSEINEGAQGFTCDVRVRVANVGLGPATSLQIAAEFVNGPDESAARLGPRVQPLPTLAPQSTDTVHFTLRSYAPQLSIGDLDANTVDLQTRFCRLQIRPGDIRVDGDYLDRTGQIHQYLRLQRRGKATGAVTTSGHARGMARSPEPRPD